MNLLSNIGQSVRLIFRRPDRQQYAALCHRLTGTEPEILLVTSRDTGRWVIPKGWPMGHRPGFDVARQEAKEEAGVVGEVGTSSIGSYCYEKGISEGFSVTCRVTVFPLAVTGELDQFKEKGKRRLEWVRASEAAIRVAEPELRTIIRNFAQKRALAAT